MRRNEIEKFKFKKVIMKTSDVNIIEGFIVEVVQNRIKVWYKDEENIYSPNFLFNEDIIEVKEDKEE